MQCVYNDDEKCWIVGAAHGGPVPPLEVFQKSIKGVGGTLEEAVSDWKEAMLIAGLQIQARSDDDF